MTVLYFADTRFPIERANGVQTMATCHALASRGHDVTLVVRPDTAPLPRDPFQFYGWPALARLQIATVPTSRGPRRRRVRFLLEALRLVRARPRAVVYTRDLGLAAFLLQLPGSRRPPVVYESHGVTATVSAEMPRLLGKPELVPSAGKLRRLDRRERRVWTHAGAYVTITRALADELAAHYGPRPNVFVVPDGATTPGVDAPQPTPGVLVAYAGHLYPWKGVDVFVQALARASGVRGLIVGGHPAEADLGRIKALIRELDLTSRVEVTGLVAPDDVVRRLARADILVLPNTASAISERYTSPLKLFEYLTLGRPIVASDLPAIREILNDGETALLVAPGDPDALASRTRPAGRRFGAGRPAGRRGTRACHVVHLGSTRGAARASACRRGWSLMISPAVFGVVQCPDCRGAIARSDGRIACGGCGRTFAADGGVLDLRPLEAAREQTRYLDHALHADARHESVAPPLLGSKIRNDMLGKFLALGPSDRAIDLGCGSGRTLAWNAASGAALTGIDIAPFFAREAIDRCDLLLGDLRRLPLRTGAFSKAWSLDVLEHLSRPALVQMLAEANRVLADDGVLFVYTHVRKNGWIAGGTRLVNRFARLCERVGLIDLRQERLRKSDHVNPLTDHDDLARVVAETGFAIERITYYTPIVGAFVENVMVRMAERFLTRRVRRTVDGRRTTGRRASEDDAVRVVRAAAQAEVRKGGATYRALVALSGLMRIDLLLFGRVRSGPFFALLRKTTRGGR